MAAKKKESAKATEPAKTAAAPTGAGSAGDFEKLGVFYLGRPYDMVAKNSRSQAGCCMTQKIWSPMQSASG